MTLMNTLSRFASLAILPAAFAACVLEDEPPRRLTNAPYDPTPEPSPGGSSSPPPTGGLSSTSPLLVTVDTDQTMTAEPGDGVGVFVEYATGGKWTIWWTCDTKRTQQSCNFAIGATAQTGNIGDVDSSGVQGGEVTTPIPSRVEVLVRTSTELHGITFTTTPGAVLTLEASVGGVKDGAFLFFVQDGKVNGGYKGKLTNPLQLQGKTP